MVAAPPGKRIWGILDNPNTFAYLLVFSNYIYFLLILALKKRRVTYLLLFLVIVNFINIILTSSRGAILTFIISFCLFAVLLLLLLRKNENKYYPYLRLLFISFFAIIIFSILFIIYSDSSLAISLKDFFIKNLFRLKWLKSGSGRTMIWDVALNLDIKTYLLGIPDYKIYPIYLEELPKFAEKFLNNSGRYHNMYIGLLLNYGIFALLGFLLFLGKSIIQIVNTYSNASFNKKLLLIFFISQFVTFIISGVFEQLALFSQSPHSLLFMFIWAILIKLIKFSDEECNCLI